MNGVEAKSVWMVIRRYFPGPSGCNTPLGTLQSEPTARTAKISTITLVVRFAHRSAIGGGQS